MEKSLLRFFAIHPSQPKDSHRRIGVPKTFSACSAQCARAFFSRVVTRILNLGASFGMSPETSQIVHTNISSPALMPTNTSLMLPSSLNRGYLRALLCAPAQVPATHPPSRRDPGAAAKLVFGTRSLRCPPSHPVRFREQSTTAFALAY